MGDPIWIWPSGGPVVFSTQSALLRLTVASQLHGATPVYFGFNLCLFCCYTTLLSLHWSPSVNTRMFLLMSEISWKHT